MILNSALTARLAAATNDCTSAEDLVLVKLAWHLISLREGNRARPYNLPASLVGLVQADAAFEGRRNARLASRVAELDGRDGSHASNKSSNAGERFCLLVVPEAQVSR